jgi:hypothetical protein
MVMDDAILYFIILFALAFTVFVLAAMWKVFVKAGQPGWACLIPIYNSYVILKIAGKPGWWLILLFIPLVNIIIVIIYSLALAERFGRGAGFGVGLAFLGFIFFPILAWGDATYNHPTGTIAAQPA